VHAGDKHNYLGKRISNRDITESKKTEELFWQSESELRKIVTEKDRLFSVISHNLRNPLNDFLELTHKMAEDLPNLTMARIQQIAVKMRDSATNLSILIENLMQLPEVQQGLNDGRNELSINENVVSIDEIDNQIDKLKILIAEDDQGSARLTNITVRLFSREIITVVSGIEAVEFCRNNPDIDLVLMDILIPGIDGYEAARQIRQFNPDIVIIAQTAYPLPGDREKSMAAGCNDYITKPVNKEQLLGLLQKYFKS
jgi:CheY-like chemotaxis protein